MPSFRIVRLALALAVPFGAAALALTPVAARAAGAPEMTPLQVRQALDAQRAAATAIKQDAIWQGARNHFHDARERAELVRRARRGDRAAIRGLRVRRAGNDEGAPVVDPPGASRSAWTGPAGAAATAAVPTNVRCNSLLTDGAAAGQAEESVAAIGSDIVVAWNDGQGYYDGTDIQGYAWSHDGGATYTDEGNPPHPPGYPAFRWSSDPVMTVNEKTGWFYYCGLASSDATHNAIAIARGRFTAGVFDLDSVFFVRTVPNASLFLDKQWIACDSLSGNLYVTNTTFGALDTIDFYRSTDGGRTWSAPFTLSSNGDAGWVQGSRIAVGPAGEVVVAWYAQDQVTDEDNIRFRRSTDGGVSFAAETTPVKFNQQFGTGGPGFNRERGVNFPSLIVDRSTGTHRGRTYLAWQESWHFLSVALPQAGSTNKSEVESNGTAGTATACTAGQTLRGALTTTSSTLDQDWWAVPLTAGQSLIVYADSVTATRGWYLRLLAPDGAQRLCFGGKPDSTGGANYAYYAFTAPASGTYYLRMIQTSYRTVSYRIRTGLGGQTTERGRDQRDAFVAWTDNGASWSTPARVNDDGPGYDLFLPELAVGGDGMAYLKWFDFRDDVYGSRAYTYLSRSPDGSTWAANRVAASVQSNFTTAGSNIAPNMGDYGGITSSGSSIVPTWADGRVTTSVDVWSATVPTTSDIAACPADTTIQAPGTASFGWTLANANPMFDGLYTTTLSCGRAWTVTGPASAAVAAGATAFYSADVAVPDTAAAGVVPVCLTLRTPGGVLVGQCCFNVTVTPSNPTGTPPAAYRLTLANARPNPAPGAATLAFTLPHAGAVRLAIYDLSGARIRTLVDGTLAGGPTQAVWNGLDDHGQPARAGAYFFRLEFEGQKLSRRLVIVR